MSDKILDIRNLTVDFKTLQSEVRAVSNVSFSVGIGETVGIVGESGSGKSATALAIMRLLPVLEGKVTAGEILFARENQDIGAPDNLVTVEENLMRKIRGKEIAMIFQGPMTSLNPVFTCGEQVEEAIKIHERDIQKKDLRLQTMELFRKVALQDPMQIYKSYPHQLSGGQKQRVLIAMAISGHPRLLIADEPTTALDVTVQSAILKLIRNIREEFGSSMLFISHDLGVISEIADRVVVMYKGQIVEEGKTEDVFREPVHPYTKGLLACRPFLNQNLKRLPEISDFMETDQQGAMQKRNHSIEEVREHLFISKDDRIRQQEKLYKHQPILSVKGLTTRFKVNRGIFSRGCKFMNAVDNMSFDVFPGETLGLVGESGCGKTTLGRTILRLIPAYSGQVEFMGKDLFSLNTQDLRFMRRHIQMIFQDPYGSLNPGMTVGESILEPMQVHGLQNSGQARKDKVVELLERVRLSADHADRYPHEFSGGQRQRIVIARALSVNPGFIICDEPVSALDVSVQAQVLNLLNDLKRDLNLSLIFISHDLSIVKFMSDRMIVMKNGKIEEQGSPDDLYSNPTSDYTKRLIASVPGQKQFSNVNVTRQKSM